MWMNAGDIDFPERRESSQQERAREFLRAFKDLINEISDGWAYWSYGTRCSHDLQDMLAHTAPDPSTTQVDAAKKKVLRFLARCKQTKDKPTVQAFIARWR